MSKGMKWLGTARMTVEGSKGYNRGRISERPEGGNKDVFVCAALDTQKRRGARRQSMGAVPYVNVGGVR